MFLKDFLKKICIQSVVLICTVLFICLEPLVGLIYIAIFAIRLTVVGLSKIFRPDLAKIVPRMSMIFGSDDLYNQPKSTLLLSGYIKEKIDYTKICEGICMSLLDPTNSAGGLQNPEGRMYLTSYLGFRFWKPEVDFKVTDHVHLYENFDKFFPPSSSSTTNSTNQNFAELTIKNGFKEINEDNFMKIGNRLNLRYKPFARKKAPWECLLFNLKDPDCNSEDGLDEHKYKGLIILRLHHSICDGFSILKRIFALNGSQLVIQLPESAKISFLKRLIYVLVFPIITPYHVFNQLIACRDSNAWHLPESSYTGKILTGNTMDISTVYIKTIKKNLKSTFNAVILAAMSGGIRNYMLENDIKVPNAIHCMTVLPMPHHPEKLRNHMTACFAKLPLGIKDPLDRLRAVDQNIEELKKSIFPLTFFTCFGLLGALFTKLVRLMRTNTFATAALANIPGPPGPIQIFGHNVIGMGFSGGLHGSIIGVSITCVSFNGSIRIAAHIDQALVPSQEKMDDLMDKIENEFHILYREGIL